MALPDQPGPGAGSGPGTGAGAAGLGAGAPGAAGQPRPGPGPRPHPFGPDSQTARAMELYAVSSSRVPREFWRSVLTVKEAACRCNLALGYLPAPKARAILQAIDWLREPGQEPCRLDYYLCLDAWQGGAGTSMNLNVNEALSLVAGQESGCPVDPLEEVNLHQSTNDVLPTALRLMLLDRLGRLEGLVTGLQAACQDREQAWAGTCICAHTQLQDAIIMDAGKLGSTWAGCLGRDRWRLFKGRERLKEVNLGGTAIGSGSGAPRNYVLGVIRELQKLTPHPVTKSEDLFEATSNHDGVTEAMETLNILAQDLNRIAQDIRLLASGPGSGLALLRLPAWLKGSSLMPGKVNPVMAELAMQVAQRVMANHSLLVRTAAQSELQLNAFFPLMLQTCHESLELLEGLLPGFARYVTALELDLEAARQSVDQGSVTSLVLVPLLGYHCVEAMVQAARSRGVSLLQELRLSGLLPEPVLDSLASPRLALAQGYDPEFYRRLGQEHGPALAELTRRYLGTAPEHRPAGQAALAAHKGEP